MKKTGRLGKEKVLANEQNMFLKMKILKLQNRIHEIKVQWMCSTAKQRVRGKNQ